MWLKWTLCALTLSNLLASCHSHSFRLEGCPKVKVMKDFEMEKFLGEWFVVGRFNPLSTCSRFELQKSEDGIYVVNETSNFLGFDLGFRGRNRSGRKLTTVSNETEAIFRLDRNFDPIGLRTFGVVETDYSTYALVWGCDPLIIGSVQNLDVLSRSPKIADEVLEEAKNSAKKRGIDLQSLEEVDHSNCVPRKIESEVLEGSVNNMFVEAE